MKRDSKACRLAFHSRLENPHLDLFFQIPGKITLPTYELTEVARAPLHHALLRVGVARGPWRFFRAERKKDHRPHYWTYQGPMGKEYLHHIGYGECNGSVLTEVFFLRMALLQPFFSQKYLHPGEVFFFSSVI